MDKLSLRKPKKRNYIMVTEEKLRRIIKEELERDVLYTAQVVVDPRGLMERYPSELPRKYYHHSTNRFGSQPFDGRDGERMVLRIVGRLTTDKVDVLVVENPNSSNEVPHITLATADGVRPVQSNHELRDNMEKVVALDDSVETVFRNILRN